MRARHPALGLASVAAVYVTTILHCALHAGWWTGLPAIVAMAVSAHVAQRSGVILVPWSHGRSVVWWGAWGVVFSSALTRYAEPLPLVGAAVMGLSGVLYFAEAWRRRRSIVLGAHVLAVRLQGHAGRCANA